MDRGSAVNFGADSALRTVLMFGSWVLNEIWIQIQIISFFEQSSFKLRRETVIAIVLCYSHQACCLLYYLCEITSNNGILIYLSECICGFEFEKNYWRIDGFGEKRHGSADLHTPY